jgi:hypothetical protein
MVPRRRKDTSDQRSSARLRAKQGPHGSCGTPRAAAARAQSDRAPDAAACPPPLNLPACPLSPSPPQSLISGDEFQHILRVLNTNVDGKQKVMYAMTAIRGLGRRFSNLVCKKAEVDMKKR